MSKSLIIWLPTGETMKFEEVKNFQETAKYFGPAIKKVIVFDYKGVSTKEYRKATFLDDKIMGYAITDTEREDK